MGSDDCELSEDDARWGVTAPSRELFIRKCLMRENSRLSMKQDRMGHARPILRSPGNLISIKKSKGEEQMQERSPARQTPGYQQA